MKTKLSQITRKGTVLTITTFLLFTNCKDDDTPPDCGCQAETQGTISELVGRMAFKTQSHPTDTYYNDHYWITSIEQDAATGVKHMVVCNEGILKDDFDDLKSLPQSEYIEVKFSGNLKQICETRIGVGVITYDRITLTSIERQ